ncbi:MAG: threonine--tRNA ligase [Elusimicrobia bacterium RIFOXYD2_FULL_34_15]|nr:MAG: threonine--tRNA ligase [Elusimicrobia bacterium RIFOXYD2_FULL_34_15]
MEKSKSDLEILRHSTSHVMAQAVCELFPDTKLAIGPAIEDGFYYDFDTQNTFTPADLPKIEEKMKQIVKGHHKFIRTEMSKNDAIEFFKKKNESYKVELINDIPYEKVSLYQHDTFIDLCRGPHLESTKEIRYFKLLSIAGAYWRGSEKNKMLQRIYGTVFNTKEELDAHIKKLEEMKRRDHRILGKALDLFSVHDEVGPGLILWHPKGALIRKIIEDFWKDEHLKNGYQLLNTPHIAHLEMWKTSGHWNFYRENMYSPIDIDGQEYMLKPMNCPFHIMVYKSHLRSYRDLPIRYAELGTVYRYEKSGVLHGLMRVRGFTQDDAHLYCRLDQLEKEIIDVIKFVIFVLKTFGFNEYDIFVSTRPGNSVGDLDHWEKATNALKKAIEHTNLTYQIDPGEGVFYGPKIDIKIKDCFGRSWQCSTIQVDFNMPNAFKVEYIGEDGKPAQPVMIHRALMGSLERFFGVLIEHYGGAFPFWLAPVQLRILPISEAQIEYAGKIKKELGDYRVEIDSRNEKLGYKMREAQIEKIPFILVLGEKEQTSETVAVRKYGENTTQTFEIIKFLDILKSLEKK